MPDGIKEETMDTPMRRVGGLAAVALLVVAACTSGATPSPTSVPTVSPEASVPATTEASPSAVASPTAVATVPDGQLIFAGKLVICSDIPYPPQEFFDAQGNPTGSDIEIGQEIAKRLGLTAQIENAVFDTIIAAVTGGKCDIIISAQNITPDRVKQVDMIPYFQAGQSFVVAKRERPRGHQRATTDLISKGRCRPKASWRLFYDESRLPERDRRPTRQGAWHRPPLENRRWQRQDRRQGVHQGHRSARCPPRRAGRRLLRRFAGRSQLHHPARRPVRSVGHPAARPGPRGHQRAQGQDGPA